MMQPLRNGCHTMGGLPLPTNPALCGLRNVRFLRSSPGDVPVVPAATQLFKEFRARVRASS